MAKHCKREGGRQSPTGAEPPRVNSETSARGTSHARNSPFWSFTSGPTKPPRQHNTGRTTASREAIQKAPSPANTTRQTREADFHEATSAPPPGFPSPAALGAHRGGPAGGARPSRAARRGAREEAAASPPGRWPMGGGRGGDGPKRRRRRRSRPRRGRVWRTSVTRLPAPGTNRRADMAPPRETAAGSGATSAATGYRRALLPRPARPGRGAPPGGGEGKRGVTHRRIRRLMRPDTPGCGCGSTREEST